MYFGATANCDICAYCGVCSCLWLSVQKTRIFDVCGKNCSLLMKEKGDHALMLFVMCTGIPPHIIDVDEFKDLVAS